MKEASLNMIPIEDYRKLVKENADLKEKEVKYQETIRHLKNSMDLEKKNGRSLRAEKVNVMMQRNELEEFFL
jgi:FtsZ-binding cell division protein ZapB